MDREPGENEGEEKPEMPGIVEGKVAIVTGAGRGIGRGIALLMAQEGARVVVCDIGASVEGAGSDDTPAHEVVAEIKKAGGQAIASTLSISEPANGDKIVKAALDAFGRVDILVNNAGILRDRIFHRMSWADWSDVINVHLHGSFIMSRACAGAFPRAEIRQLRAHDLDLGPRRQFRPGQLHGGEARHRRALARHRARHGALQRALELRVAVRLDAHGAIHPRRGRGAEGAPRPRCPVTPEKVAPLVVYLASDRADGVTGQILSARNNEIYLFNQNRPVRTLHRSDGWTPEKLAEQLKPRLRQLLHAARAVAEVFSWDPV